MCLLNLQSSLVEPLSHHGPTRRHQRVEPLRCYTHPCTRAQNELSCAPQFRCYLGRPLITKEATGKNFQFSFAHIRDFFRLTFACRNLNPPLKVNPSPHSFSLVGCAEKHDVVWRLKKARTCPRFLSLHPSSHATCLGVKKKKKKKNWRR